VPLSNSEVYRQGIFTEKEINASGSEDMIDRVYEKVKNLIRDNKLAVVLGGEHSVSIGAVKAHAENYGDLCVLQLDAHSDFRDTYEGNRYSHACVMSRIREMVPDTVSVGIRSMDSSEKEIIKKDSMFFAYKIFQFGDWMRKVVDKLTKNVYITIDLDVFDSSIMLSTGTPEPGGLNWRQVTGLLKSVCENRNIVGFDVVELCPSGNKAPDFLAAKLIYKILSYRQI
jgi:agmatinase